MELCILSILCNFDWNLNIWFFFPKYFIFTLQACFKKQFFFPHYLQVYCIFVSVYWNKSQVFLKKQNRNKQKNPNSKAFHNFEAFYSHSKLGTPDVSRRKWLIPGAEYSIFTGQPLESQESPKDNRLEETYIPSRWVGAHHNGKWNTSKK